MIKKEYLNSLELNSGQLILTLSLVRSFLTNKFSIKNSFAWYFLILSFIGIIFLFIKFKLR
jgi:hypothetical protein